MAEGTAANPITLDSHFALATLNAAVEAEESLTGERWEAANIKLITDFARRRSIAATCRWWQRTYPEERALSKSTAARFRDHFVANNTYYVAMTAGRKDILTGAESAELEHACATFFDDLF